MSFAAPELLPVLLVVPLLAGAAWLASRRRRRYALRLPAARTLVAAAAPRAPWARRVPGGLLLAGACALGLAVARPQATVHEPVEQASILLVNDTSGSMVADDVAPSRLDAAREAAEEFVDQLPAGVRVGALSYSDAAALTQSPTEDHDAVRGALQGLSAQGGTATGEALDTALKALRPDGTTGAPAAIVFLSDGATTVGRDPVGVAARARELGVPVYTVALGTSGGSIPDPRGMGGRLAVPPDPATLEEIARRSGGRAFTAQDADGLAAVYRELGSRLGTEEREREISVVFAAGGLLLVAGGLLGGVRRRPAVL